jgi:hypothetical protein
LFDAGFNDIAHASDYDLLRFAYLVPAVWAIRDGDIYILDKVALAEFVFYLPTIAIGVLFVVGSTSSA